MYLDRTRQNQQYRPIGSALTTWQPGALSCAGGRAEQVYVSAPVSVTTGTNDHVPVYVINHNHHYRNGKAAQCCSRRQHKLAWLHSFHILTRTRLKSPALRLAFGFLLTKVRGHAVTQLVETPRYKPEGLGFDSPRVSRIFHWHNPPCRTMALGLTQPLTEMSIRNMSSGGKVSRCVGPSKLPTLWTDCLEI